MAEALLVCADDKPFAALPRQCVDAPAASQRADGRRLSPGQADEGRATRRAQHAAWGVAPAEPSRAPTVRDIKLADSLGEPHQTTRQLEPGDVHHDHHDRSTRTPRDQHGWCSLVCPLRLGPLGGTVARRLDLRAKPVRCRAAPGLPQHTPPGAPDFGSPPSALAPRLDGVCPVRPWGRLGTMEPLGPSPQRAGARPPPGPSPAPGGAPRPAGCRAQAPALDARAPHRDGWDQHDLLRASDYRASPRCAPRGPCRGGHTAPPGAIRGVLAADGAHALGPPGLAG